MKFQLVMQFPEARVANHDEMIALEDDLIEGLGEMAKVDGHDWGSGEMNIFVHTDEPAKAFDMCKTALAKRKLLEIVIAAYREITGVNYTVIWPIGFAKQFRIT